MGHEGLLGVSLSHILDNQHRTGALVASPDFSQYRFCWLRDGSFIAHALDTCGEHGASWHFHRWCASAIARVEPLMSAALERKAAGKPVEPSEMPPARFSLDGHLVADEWPNFQLDGYGTWLWSLSEHLARAGAALPPDVEAVVRTTARYLAGLGDTPCFDVWEEAGSLVHGSTLGAVHAGLLAATALLGDPQLAEAAGRLRSRLLGSAEKTGSFHKSEGNPKVDASLLWLGCPFGVVAPDDGRLLETVSRIESELDLDGGLRRYRADTYYGGGAWPVLTASLGWHRVAVGDLAGAERCLAWVADRFGDDGRLAEQFGGERVDAVMHAEWVKRWGPPAGDLLWSHAMFLILSDALATAKGGRVAPPMLDEACSDQLRKEHDHGG